MRGAFTGRYRDHVTSACDVPAEDDGKTKVQRDIDWSVDIQQFEYEAENSSQ